MNLRRFSTAFLCWLIFICGASLPVAAVYEQKTERQFLLLWKDEQVWGSGRHQPYAEMKLSDEDGTLLWEERSDVRGYFEFLLAKGVLSSDENHLLTVRAFDQFGREIQKNDGSPDTLQRKILSQEISPTSTIEDETSPVSPDSQLLTPNSQPLAGEFPSAPADDSKSNEGVGIFWKIFLGIALAGGTGLGGFFFWKKRSENLIS